MPPQCHFTYFDFKYLVNFNKLGKFAFVIKQKIQYMGFRLAYFYLTLAHSKCERSRLYAIELREIRKMDHAAFRRISASTLPSLIDLLSRTLYWCVGPLIERKLFQ